MDKLQGWCTVNTDGFQRLLLVQQVLVEKLLAIDFNKKFRVVLEHNPEKNYIEFTFYGEVNQTTRHFFNDGNAEQREPNDCP